MKPREVDSYQRILSLISNSFFLCMGLLFTLAAMTILVLSCWRTLTCLGGGCDLLTETLDLASRLIIAAAIFDVGRYLLEEEVFRDRELRSPSEARRSLTKFMVIIVIAVTLESLLAVIKAGTEDVSKLVYPAILFFVAVFLLVGLGLYQRLSVLAETDVLDRKS